MKLAHGEITKLSGHDISLSHRDKVLFPKDGITKGDLLAYYAGIAPWMIPLVKNRPVMMQRYPNGIHSTGFIQQQASDYFPDWLEQVSVERTDSPINHVLLNDAASLVYLANLGVIAFHIWQSRADKLNYPDRMVFDLDPPGDNFALACSTAKVFRELLKELDLPAYVMTTGSRGLHVVVPLDRSEEFDAVRGFARTLGDWMARQLPDHLTVEHRKRNRGNRLFLDALRNTYAHTAVAPYSVRPLDGAPVATPVEWEELSSCKLGSRHYTIRTVFSRLKQKGDPWKDMSRKATSLTRARQRFAKMARTNLPATAVGYAEK